MLLQLERLEEVFRESKYPDVYRREEIAAQLDIKEEVVRVSISFQIFQYLFKRNHQQRKTVWGTSVSSKDK